MRVCISHLSAVRDVASRDGGDLSPSPPCNVDTSLLLLLPHTWTSPPAPTPCYLTQPHHSTSIEEVIRTKSDIKYCTNILASHH